MKLIQKIRGEMETERLFLRRWRLADFNDFLKFVADAQVMAASGAKPARNLEEAEAELHRAIRDTGCYAIVLKATGEPIGKIKFQKDLRRSADVNSLSIGYQLVKEQWGHGYMPEALQAMIVCAFEKKKVDVLGISHFTVNDRSRRVIEKCGFRREGVIHHAFRRYDGEIFDDECYSILREEYFADRGKYLNAGDGPEKELPENAGEAGQ